MVAFRSHHQGPQPSAKLRKGLRSPPPPPFSSLGTQGPARRLDTGPQVTLNPHRAHFRRGLRLPSQAREARAGQARDLMPRTQGRPPCAHFPPRLRAALPRTPAESPPPRPRSIRLPRLEESGCSHHPGRAPAPPKNSGRPLLRAPWLHRNPGSGAKKTTCAPGL